MVVAHGDHNSSSVIEQRKRLLEDVAHESIWHQTLRLALCAGGTLLCYLWFGIIQESITRGKYGEKEQDRFTYTQALVFVQCAANTIFAYLLRGKSRDGVPIRLYVFVSISYLTAMIASNHALQYIPYPTQVLGKSCKPIPIMVFGFLFAGKKYTWRKYLYVMMIVFGVAMFLYKEKAAIANTKSMYSIGFGEMLLLLSLAMDGSTGAIQDSIRQHHRVNAHSMMYHMNLFSSFILLFGLSATGEFAQFLEFVTIYPKVIVELLILAAVSALGQYFIFKTVAEFGPLTCSIVTTTRKLFTMLGSVILFGNTLNQRQSIATIIVFTALLLDAYDSKRKRAKMIHMTSNSNHTPDSHKSL